MTHTFHPHIEFTPGFYPRIRVWHPDKQTTIPIYLHRLTAYAHGELNSLWAEKDVHHCNADSWDNRPENLEAVDRQRHAEYEPQVANLD